MIQSIAFTGAIILYHIILYNMYITSTYIFYYKVKEQMFCIRQRFVHFYETPFVTIGVSHSLSFMLSA